MDPDAPRTELTALSSPTGGGPRLPHMLVALGRSHTRRTVAPYRTKHTNAPRPGERPLGPPPAPEAEPCPDPRPRIRRDTPRSLTAAGPHRVDRHPPPNDHSTTPLSCGYRLPDARSVPSQISMPHAYSMRASAPTCAPVGGRGAACAVRPGPHHRPLSSLFRLSLSSVVRKVPLAAYATYILHVEPRRVSCAGESTVSVRYLLSFIYLFNIFSNL